MSGSEVGGFVVADSWVASAPPTQRPSTSAWRVRLVRSMVDGRAGPMDQHPGEPPRNTDPQTAYAELSAIVLGTQPLDHGLERLARGDWNERSSRSRRPTPLHAD